MEDIILEPITIEEFKQEIYLYYLEIFPEEERKPIKQIESGYKKGYIKIIKIVNQNQLVGFMTLNRVKEKGYVILDYLAILPEYRNKQFGTEALKLLLKEERECKGIFVEIEKVGLGESEQENLIRQKRKAFYENVGFKELKFDLFLFDVIYTPLLFSNEQENEDIIIDSILEIYETITGKERIKKNCKIMKRLRFEEITKENIKIAAKTQYEIFPTSSAYVTYKTKVTGKNDHFYIGYIAYLEDEPIGVTGLYEIPEYSDTVWLSWFGLKEEYRKAGYGKQLLDYTIKIAKEYHKKYLRLYTFEMWNKEAQKFYKKNMDIDEYYFNEKEHKEIFEGKPKIFSISLCDEKVDFWNNKFINILADEASHEKGILMMKEDGII
jgi:GNAT superfamily N-acetyltransferase